MLEPIYCIGHGEHPYRPNDGTSRTLATAAIEIEGIKAWALPTVWLPICESHLPSYLNECRVVEFSGS